MRRIEVQFTVSNNDQDRKFRTQSNLFIVSLIAWLLMSSCSYSIPTHFPSPTPDSQAIRSNTRTTPQPGIKPSAFSSLLDTTDFYYEAGDFELVILIYSEVLLYPLSPDQTVQVFSLRADAYGQMGNFDKAIEDYLKAIELGEHRPLILNSLCWDLGIVGKPEQALPYCEQAARDKLIPEYRDSRGIVYAMLGKRVAALADFKAVVEGLSTDSPEYQKKVDQRKEWIRSLESGINPITSEILAELRNETSASMALPTSTPGAPSEVTREEIEQTALKLGFASFKNVNQPESADVSTSLVNGNCHALLKLYGSDIKLSGALLSMNGCEEIDESRYASWLIEQFLPGKENLSKALVWLAVDIDPLIKDKSNQTLTRQIGAFTFSVQSRLKDTSSLTILIQLNE